ncbi:kinase-like domain-containing protein, partial [Cristinia sonorae]
RPSIYNLVCKLAEVTGDILSPFSLSGVERDTQPVHSGGFSTVYRGTWENRTVAVRQLHRFNAQPEKSDSFQESFSGELLKWRQLRHPNVLPFLGVDQQKCAPRLAMISPWIKNGTAREMIEKMERPPIMQWVREVAEGLEYLHDEMVVHGDLRGANILVDDDMRVRLTDFGLATFAHPRHSRNSVTCPRARWMAPELLDDSIPRPNRSTDVFSFASTCLELFTGKVPFSKVDRTADVARIVINGERPSRPICSDCIHQFPDTVWELMQDCWLQNPSERPKMSTVTSLLRQTSGDT